MNNKNLSGEVYFKVEHNYSVRIPGNKIDIIKAAMEAEIQEYKDGNGLEYMDEVYALFSSKYEDALESALLVFAYYYGDDFGAHITDNGYDGDDEDIDIQVRL